MGKGGKPKNWPPPAWKARPGAKGTLVLKDRAPPLEVGVPSPVTVQIDPSSPKSPPAQLEEKTTEALADEVRKQEKN